MFFFLPLSVLRNCHNQSFAAIFYESFLGTYEDGAYFDVWQGNYAEFAFDLTSLGDQAILYDEGNSVIDGPVSPSTDEINYTGSAYDITSASLDFTFSSADWPSERVLIHSVLYDNQDGILSDVTYSLGWGWPFYFRDYTDLSIDLIALGLEAYLEDGIFITLVIAPEMENSSVWSSENDFRIDTASLTLEATPVPLPAAIWLFGTSLIGLIGWRKSANYLKKLDE